MRAGSALPWRQTVMFAVFGGATRQLPGFGELMGSVNSGGRGYRCDGWGAFTASVSILRGMFNGVVRHVCILKISRASSWICGGGMARPWAIVPWGRLR